MFLIDTDVLWQLRGHPGGDAGVYAWAERQRTTDLFVSAISMMEIGLAGDRISRTDKEAGASTRRWLEGRLAAAFEGRVLPIDGRVAARASRLQLGNLSDRAVAATALEHGLTLATLAPTAFRPAKVKLLNPGDPRSVEADRPLDTDWRQASRGGPVGLRNLFARG